MKALIKILSVFGLAMLFVLFIANTTTQAQDETVNKPVNKGFVDLNGDGYNDNAPDADGDGIPNGRDEDYDGPMSRNGNNGTKGFVDLNGDGINDNAIDSDGDGIPNGQDPDYVKPQDGSGKQNRNGIGNKNSFKNQIRSNSGNGGYGPGDGTGNNGIGPKDGTGYGPGNGSGTGNCDGTGPKGNRGGRGGKG
jgi:hypothetical protein